MIRERVLQIIPVDDWFACFSRQDLPFYSTPVEAFVFVEITDELNGRTWRELRPTTDGLCGLTFAKDNHDYDGVRHGFPVEELESM